MNQAAATKEEEKGEIGNLWNRYQGWARTNQHVLWLLDESVSRLLFWTPPSVHSSRWREALWGILELHRLALDIATSPDKNYFSNNAYGTSVEIIPTDDVPANRIRIALTILQHVLPVVLAMSTQDQNKSRSSSTIRQQLIRKYFERIRFGLRFTLLINYWRQMLANKAHGSSLGLLLHGGQYDMSFNVGIPWQQETSMIERTRFVGSRTGRRVHNFHDNHNHNSSFHDMRVILGEILYILRPLLQTEMKGTMKHWSQCLLLDFASLWILSYKTPNRITEGEWKRRRLRLFLYFLRPPIYTEHTEPTAELISEKLMHIPVVGRLLSNYIWDYMNYWEYRAEEL